MSSWIFLCISSCFPVVLMPPLTVAYLNCYDFFESQSDAITPEQGIMASSMTDGPLISAQASTCIAQCAIHGYQYSGVAFTTQCWCFRDFPFASHNTVTCAADACILATVADTFPSGTFDDRICGAMNQIALHSMQGGKLAVIGWSNWRCATMLYDNNRAKPLPFIATKFWFHSFPQLCSEFLSWKTLGRLEL